MISHRSPRSAVGPNAVMTPHHPRRGVQRLPIFPRELRLRAAPAAHHVERADQDDRNDNDDDVEHGLPFLRET